jgi:ADP-ribosylglycohydrolase
VVSVAGGERGPAGLPPETGCKRRSTRRPNGCRRSDVTSEVSAAVAEARAQATDASPSPEGAQRLGEGWVAEQALAIAVYAVSATRSFRDVVITAVNHGGDSDSTGAIAGNLAGHALWSERDPRGVARSRWSYET